MAELQQETLGQVVRKKRHLMGMSLRDVADASGVHRSTVDRIENDISKVIDPTTICAIADVLHLDRLYLLSLNNAGVQDGDIRIIARAAKKLSPEQRQQMMDYLRATYSEAFQSSESDDLDNNGSGYLDEPV